MLSTRYWHLICCVNSNNCQLTKLNKAAIQNLYLFFWCQQMGWDLSTIYRHCLFYERISTIFLHLYLDTLMVRWYRHASVVLRNGMLCFNCNGVLCPKIQMSRHSDVLEWTVHPGWGLSLLWVTNLKADLGKWHLLNYYVIHSLCNWQFTQTIYMYILFLSSHVIYRH